MTNSPPSWELHLGDGIAGMAAMDDASVDHVITDPPYDDQTHNGALNPIDFCPLATFEHVTQAIRIARRWVIMFCALEQLGEYKKAAGDLWIRSGTWVRTNGSPQKTGDRPAQGSEGIFIAHRAGRKAWNGGGKAGTWIGPIAEQPRVHPTQKPDWLMDALLLDFTDLEDTVLDCFAGSATTLVSAVRLGRIAKGFEMDERHHANGLKRLSAAREQLTLPAARRPKPKQLTVGTPCGDERAATTKGDAR